ncbi:MAG TPA: tetratricopeptide repeat protein [Elusimicrobiota bacterium]|nr:tetratricopeptide repeat protein [Elusimicrobiota bacterium]
MIANDIHRFIAQINNNRRLIFLRAIIIVFGVFTAFIGVEIALRAAGGLLASIPRGVTLENEHKKGDYVILCLGESTTQRQWPGPLEEELNGRKLGVRFRVIDRGKAGTGSTAILYRLEHELERNRPDMVIVMMGINDGEWIWENPVIYDDTLKVKSALFLKNMRVNKMWRYIRGGLVNRWFENVDLADYRKAQDEDQDLLARIERGVLYQKKGEYDRAKAIFRKAIKTNPEDPRGYLAMGELYRLQGNYEKALEMYETAIRMAPREGRAYDGLESLFCSGEDFNRVVRYFEMAINNDTKDPLGYGRLAHLYHLRMQFDMAEKYYKAAVRAAPQESMPYNELCAFYHERRKEDEVVSVLQSAIRAMPNELHFYMLLGQRYCEAGKYEEAEKVYREEIKANPNMQKGYIELGDLYRRIKKYDKAFQIYRECLRTLPSQPRGYMSLGDLYRELGEYRKAENMYKAYIEVSEKDPEGYIQLGELYRLWGDPDRAIEMNKIALSVTPRDSQLYMRLGGLYHLRGEHEKAGILFKQGLAHMNERPVLNGALALSAFLEGNSDMVSRYRRKSYLRLEVARNYQKLRDMVLAAGAELVCMQYPMRDLSSLREILGGDPRIHYVENRANFEEALRRYKYSDIFIDSFAGDFGHCTPLGNQIIAKNVCDVIMREVPLSGPGNDHRPLAAAEETHQ